MPHRKLMTAILLLSFGTLFAGCGGGSGDGSDAVTGNGGGSSTYLISFTPAQANPSADMVTLNSEVALNDELTVSVNVTETDGIASVSLEMTFDPAYVEFVDWSCGELLPPCGAGTLPLLSASPGRLIIGMAQISPGVGADVYGTEVLLRLTFRVLRQGASPLAFDSNGSALVDPDQNDIPGVTWHGGTIVAD